MENALSGDGVPYGGDGGGDTDGTFGSNGGTVSGGAKGAENGCLRASVLRRGTFGAKVPKTWGPFPWSPNPPQATKGKDFPFGNFSPVPVRTGRVGNDNMGILKGQNLP